MTKSLSRRYRPTGPGTCHGEMTLTDIEVKHRYAYRSKRICERHYRVGDVRKAKDKHGGYSRGFKIRIIWIGYYPKARRTRIKFTIVNEHKREVYFKRLL
jgi:hypothetical protein